MDHANVVDSRERQQRQTTGRASQKCTPPERHDGFLIQLQRLLSEGSFVASYEFDEGSAHANSS